MSAKPECESKFVDLEGTRIHYLEAGEGDAVLMIHGWPTSSHLYRNILPAIGQQQHAIALDLPGFGQSDKPANTRYSFSYYEYIIEQFLDALGISKVDLVVHDLGGPVGMMWAIRHQEKLRRLVLLNTLVYPEMSTMVKLFMISLRLPGMKQWISSHRGITFSMRFGVENKNNLTEEVMKPYLEPFTTKETRTGLLKGGQGLSLRGFREIADRIQEIKNPVRLIYGENDRILPDVAETMRRVKADLPQAEITALPNCGHFLQEDNPQAIADLLIEFFEKD